MAKQPSFPITIMAGSAAIRIYLDPLKASGQDSSKSRSGKSDAGKSYDSYVVSYYQGGKRIRTRHNSL